MTVIKLIASYYVTMIIMVLVGALAVGLYLKFLFWAFRYILKKIF